MLLYTGQLVASIDAKGEIALGRILKFMPIQSVVILWEDGSCQTVPRSTIHPSRGIVPGIYIAK